MVKRMIGKQKPRAYMGYGGYGDDTTDATDATDVTTATPWYTKTGDALSSLGTGLGKVIGAASPLLGKTGASTPSSPTRTVVQTPASSGSSSMMLPMLAIGGGLVLLFVLKNKKRG